MDMYIKNSVDNDEKTEIFADSDDVAITRENLEY